MLPETIKTQIEIFLTEKVGRPVEVKSQKSLGGGCINEAFQVKTNEGNYFVKYNITSKFSGMFLSEAKGLEILSNASEIDVPKVICENSDEKYSFLLLNYIESSSPGSLFWQNFGISLAKLHKHKSDFFGLETNNYIGSLPQSNNKHNNWISFFIEERIEKQLELAYNKSIIGKSTILKFNNLYKLLGEIFPVEPPSLLHGDLWSGNFMVNSFGEACIFDPAIYYGFREMDIAMTKLFGGFSAEFYYSYNEAFSLLKEWEKRIDICNLYPLLVHLNLFGESYLQSINNIIHKF